VRLLDCFGLFEAEVPIERQVLALGVAHDALAVAAELRVVRREQDQPSKCPVSERIGDLGVALDSLDLPVGGNRAEVDDPHVADWGYLLDRFILGSGDIAPPALGGRGLSVPGRRATAGGHPPAAGLSPTSSSRGSR